jgi:Tol biopolymer transport system component
VNGTVSGTSINGTTIDSVNLFPPPPTRSFTLSKSVIAKDGNSITGTWTETASPNSGSFVSGRANATAAGTNVTVNLGAGRTITFADVNTAGSTALVLAPTASTAMSPQFTVLGAAYLHVITTAGYTAGAGAITVCGPYPDANNDGFVDGINPPFPEASLQVHHLEGGFWVDRTYSIDTANNIICARTDSLSEFAIVTPYLKGGFEIAFTTARDGNLEVYGLQPDGYTVGNWSNNSANDIAYGWKPDGSKLAFTSDRDDNNEVYTMDPFGGSEVNLTNHAAEDFGGFWSPDGTKILFQSNRDGNQEVYVMNADGSNQVRLTNNSAYDFPTGWSPIGDKISFMTDRDGNYEIYVMGADGSNPDNLTENAANDSGGTWSPDGTKIAFSSDRFSGNTDIYVMEPDGDDPTRLTDDTGVDQAPFWKGSSEEIVFFSDRTTDNEVYRMRADGSNEVRLTYSAGVDISGPWRPIDHPFSDFDSDGCLDSRELHSSQVTGGRRNPQNFWDFFDTPNASNVRDKAVASADFNRVLQRFGATDAGPGVFYRYSDPLSMPNAFVPGAHRANYHPAFDRAGAPAGQEAWDLSAANGAIASTDFNFALQQFGHNCN